MPVAAADVDLAVTWFLAARGIVAARDDVGNGNESGAPGLYAQAVLGLGEDVCLEAKKPERIGSRTLVDCLAAVRRLDPDTSEKIVTGVLMIALADGAMHPLEVRWLSMLASAAGLAEADMQRCCAAARVIATMVRPRATEAPA